MLAGIFLIFFELKKIKISKGRCGNVKAILRKKKNYPRDKSKKASFIHLVTGHSKLSKIINIKLVRFNFSSIGLRPSAS